MVYHLYRQPLPLASIPTLLILFSFNAMARLGLVTSQGQFQASSFWLSAQALPLVIAVTWAARRYGSAGSMNHQAHGVRAAAGGRSRAGRARRPPAGGRIRRLAGASASVRR